MAAPAEPPSLGSGGMNFVNIKIEPKSPNCQSSSLTHVLDINGAGNRDPSAGGGVSVAGGNHSAMDSSNSAMMTGPSAAHYTGETRERKFAFQIR